MEKLKYLWHKFLYIIGIMVIIFAVYGAYHEQYGFEIPEANYISACDGKEVVSSIKTQCTKMDGVRNDRPIYAEIITDVYAIRDVYKTTVYRRFCFPKGARSVQFVLREFIQDANNGDKQGQKLGQIWIWKKLIVPVLKRCSGMSMARPEMVFYTIE